MTDRLLLKPHYRAMLDALMCEHLSSIEVWAYGSRVKGRARAGSDLDLVLRAPNLEEIPISQIARFRDALDDSDIPILVEARDWASLPENFHREIMKDYVVLHTPGSTAAP